MTKYTIEDIKEEYENSKYVITNYDSAFCSRDLLDKILFLSDKIVTLTNKNIELEERVNKQSETLELQADINDEVISFMRGK